MKSVSHFFAALVMLSPIVSSAFAQTITIIASSPNAAEPSTNGAFTITRTGATTTALVVNFALTGTATRAADYGVLGGNAVTIPAGQASVNLPVTVTNDSLVEATETVICTITTSANYSVGTPSMATVNIADDDISSGLPTITITATNAAEPSTAGTFTVTRTGATTAVLVVNYAVTGTATSGTDYTAIATTVSIPIGQASATISVTPIDDSLVESGETVIATLSVNAAYTLGSPSSATVTITDNDSAGSGPTVTLSSNDTTASETSPNTATVTITRNGSTTSALTVQLAYSGSAVNGVDYTALPASVIIAAGQSSADLILTPINDALIEGGETAAITLVASSAYTRGTTSSIGIQITDNDNATPITTTGIVFATHGTSTMKLNVYLPATGSGPWPVVLFFGGGGWTTQSENSITPLFTNWTASGYAIVSANYITSDVEKWPAQIRDGKAAVRWVRANAAAYGFDPAHIGVTGGSSGGHIAAYVATSGGLKTARVGSVVEDLVATVGGNFEQSDAVQAAAPMFPPTDLLPDHFPTSAIPDPDGPTSPKSKLMGAPIQSVAERTATGNPMIHLRNGIPPFWITQGTADSSVAFNSSELLNAAFVRAQQPVTFWPVFGGGHGPGVSDSQEVISLMKAFFDRVLLGADSNALPLPSFTASALSGTAPLTVTFNASASTDADGVITKYAWANGDNGGASGATMSYTYDHAGVYPVCLSVRDDQGGTASVTQNIIVTPATSGAANPPAITITGPSDGLLTARPGNLMVQAAASAVIGDVASVEFWLNDEPYSWDSAPPFNVTLTALRPGRYRLVARVSDTTGNSSTTPAVNFRVLAPEDADPIPSISDGLLSMNYYRFTDGSVSYTSQRSDKLTGWTTFTPTESTLQTFPTIEVRKATDPLPLGTDPRRFLRQIITTP